MAGRKEKYATHVKPRLEEIKQWVADGNTEKVIMDTLDVTKSPWSRYKQKYPELVDALYAGKQTLIGSLQKSLYQRALGYEYEEKKVTIEKDKHGEIKSQKVEKTVKKQAPDTGALIFSLTNLTQHNDSKFYNRQDVHQEIKETRVDLSGLSDEDLKKLIDKKQKPSK